MPVPPGVLGKKLCRLGEAHPRSLKLTSWIRLLRPVMTLIRGTSIVGHKQRGMGYCITGRSRTWCLSHMSTYGDRGYQHNLDQE